MLPVLADSRACLLSLACLLPAFPAHPAGLEDSVLLREELNRCTRHKKCILGRMMSFVGSAKQAAEHLVELRAIADAFQGLTCCAG